MSLITKKYSVNTIEVLLFYLTKSIIGPQIDDEEVDINGTFANAARIASQVIKEGVSLKGKFYGDTVTRDLCRHEFHGLLYPDVDHSANIEKILNTIPGAILFRSADGLIKINIPDPLAGTAIQQTIGFIDDDTLVSDIEYSQTDTDSRLNQVKINFRNISKDFALDSFELISETFLAEDNNISLVEEMTVDGVNNVFQAEFLARVLIESSRLPYVSFEVSHEMFRMEPGDIFRIYSVRNSASMIVRILTTKLNTDFSIKVEAYLYDPAAYDHLESTLSISYNDNVFSIARPLAAPTEFTASTIDSSESIIQSVFLSFKPSDSVNVREYEIQSSLEINGSTVTNTIGYVSDSTTEEFLTYIHSPNYIATYKYRVRAKTATGKVSEWTEFVSAAVALDNLNIEDIFSLFSDKTERVLPVNTNIAGATEYLFNTQGYEGQVLIKIDATGLDNATIALNGVEFSSLSGLSSERKSQLIFTTISQSANVLSLWSTDDATGTVHSVDISVSESGQNGVFGYFETAAGDTILKSSAGAYIPSGNIPFSVTFGEGNARVTKTASFFVNVSGNIEFTAAEGSSEIVLTSTAASPIRTLVAQYSDKMRLAHTFKVISESREIASLIKNGETVTVTYSDNTADSFTVQDGNPADPLTVADIQKIGLNTIVTLSDSTFFVIGDGQAGLGIADISKSGETVTVTFDNNATNTFTVADGRGIGNVTKNGEVLTIVYTDNTTDTFTVQNGDPADPLTVTNIQKVGLNTTVTLSDDTSFIIGDGQAGLGIADISKSGETVTVTFDNNDTNTFTVADGENGAKAFTLLSSANCTITENSIAKTSGSTGNWDAGAYSLEAYTACVATARPANTDKRIMFGLSFDNGASSHWNTIAYVLYLDSGNCYIFEGGVQRNGNFGSYTTADTFSIVADSVEINYLKNGNVFYTTARASSTPLRFDCSFYSYGTMLNNVAFNASGEKGASIWYMYQSGFNLPDTVDETWIETFSNTMLWRSQSVAIPDPRSLARRNNYTWTKPEFIGDPITMAGLSNSYDTYDEDEDLSSSSGKIGVWFVATTLNVPAGYYNISIYGRAWVDDGSEDPSNYTTRVRAKKNGSIIVEDIDTGSSSEARIYYSSPKDLFISYDPQFINPPDVYTIEVFLGAVADSNGYQAEIIAEGV